MAKEEINLESVIERAVSAAVAAVYEVQNKLTAQEPQKTKLDPESIAARQKENGTALETKRTPCFDKATGARFDAIEQFDTRAGCAVVKRLENETWPEMEEMNPPRGMQVRRPDGQLTPQAKQLFYSTKRRPLYERVIGKPLDASLVAA